MHFWIKIHLSIVLHCLSFFVCPILMFSLLYTKIRSSRWCSFWMSRETLSFRIMFVTYIILPTLNGNLFQVCFHCCGCYDKYINKNVYEYTYSMVCFFVCLKLESALSQMHILSTALVHIAHFHFLLRVASAGFCELTKQQHNII